MKAQLAIAIAALTSVAAAAPLSLAMSDSVMVAQRLAQESRSKADLVCVSGRVWRRDARRSDGVWAQVAAVPEFRCSHWRMRDAIDAERASYAHTRSAPGGP